MRLVWISSCSLRLIIGMQMQVQHRLTDMQMQSAYRLEGREGSSILVTPALATAWQACLMPLSGQWSGDHAHLAVFVNFSSKLAGCAVHYDILKWQQCFTASPPHLHVDTT